jgi:fructose-1-phosphate kinase PfkB-like protein
MKLSPWMAMTTGSTIIVGLNSALQKRFILPPDGHLVPGNVHRARSVQLGVGGKGQDVAVTLTCLQYSGSLKLAQFVGSGAEGDAVYRMLVDLMGEDSMQLTVRPAGGMRTCTSIVAANSTTELVEPSDLIEESEVAELFSKLSAEKASALCFSGSMPPGCPADTYANIYSIVAGDHTICLIDTVVGLPELLRAISLRQRHGQTMLKINASELCRLAGVTTTGAEMNGIPSKEIMTAIKAFLCQHKPYAQQALSAIAITDGAHPAYLATMPVAAENEFRIFQIPVTNLMTEKRPLPWESWSRGSSTTLYPIGAGDAVAAGTLAAWKCLSRDEQQSSSLPHELSAVLKDDRVPSTRALLSAFSFGLACGTASCLQEQNSVLKPQDVLHFLNRGGRPAFLACDVIC